jgi:hypothetical protein
MTKTVTTSLADELSRWLTRCVTERRFGEPPIWTKLTVSERVPAQPSPRRRQFDVNVVLGPLGLDYRLDSAWLAMDEIEGQLREALAADVLDGRARGFLGKVAHADQSDPDGQITLTASGLATLLLESA